MIAAILAGIHVSTGTLITILVVLLIVAVLVWLLGGRWRRPRA